ncbi:TetR/AcrR family transcriptional regulator [Micromonospora sp. R77]|uniref:TetR/AcrR family transcriptional regulator n=1 Tax=Micromonospora sp. R77 TaxID=2925836 RepID=UPI001F60263D|nr:TetR/AcrR family transcriptional regulator [Micromonospora sp. R77]MCI4066631.1 TetR/AcrR family transcriptional regulator [Micromonospora sp. R77]
MTDIEERRRRVPGMSPERRRDMIVRAALPLLTTYGPAVTTAQVARAAGIGEGTVFRAFADKNALLEACVAEVLRPDTVLDELAAVDVAQPLADRLVAAATALLAHLDRLGAVLGAVHAARRPEDDQGPRRAPAPEAGRTGRPGRDESTEAVRDAVAALFVPDLDRLRLPADRLADLFVTLLTPRRQALGTPPAPAELVDLFLHGALTPTGEAR